MYLWACLLVMICLCVLTWHWRARKFYAHLPSYTNLPLLGNAYKLYGNSRKLFLTFEDITKKCESANKPFVFWAGPTPILLLSDPDDIRLVTNAFIEKPYYYKFANAWLGNGLFTAPGWIWKKNIKKMASTFIGPAVDQYQVFFNEQAQKFVQKLVREVDGDFFDPMPYLCFSALETICQVGLGVSKSKNLVTEEYYKAFHRTLQLILDRGTNILLHPDWLYRLTPAYKELLKCVDVLHKVSKTIMNNKKIERALKNGDLHIDNDKDSFKSLLDQLLELREHDPTLTDEQILWETATIILAGQETVATSLFYTLLVIGSRKDVQEKMYEEIMRTVGDRPIKKEDLVQLSYCEAVINESLRLYPPAVAVLRMADHDLKISSCTITKGTTAIINIWGAGRSKRSWGDDAAEFRPERWLPPNIPSTSSHLPFSSGKRACIGKKYSMAFLKTVLVHCIRSYEIISDESFNRMEFKIDIVLRPLKDCSMKIQPRK
ncbi:cytochrome P450 4C1-like isoform X1 [Pieris napi]|uniref:cytochrome P450 4C1-like isoform X1 n=1 Tax=Pieris napi TaxID=78633 RepID=UPI001FBA9AAA|nr:cytochrome P450 4C1-like isoform X1 [Pieris napi]